MLMKYEILSNIFPVYNLSVNPHVTRYKISLKISNVLDLEDLYIYRYIICGTIWKDEMSPRGGVNRRLKTSYVFVL
jgi:hypothetical protein